MLALALTLLLAGPQEVAEPKTGVALPARVSDMSLVGIGLRTKTFLKVKVYVVGLYVEDHALSGLVSAHPSDLHSSAFYHDLVSGDFPKQVTLRFVRDVSTDQIRDAFRETLPGANGKELETFLGFFGDTHSGDTYEFKWASGGGLETAVQGQARPAIADRKFGEAVFNIWLGDKPVQEDIKRDLVARASAPR